MKKPSLLEGDYMGSVSPCAQSTCSSSWYGNTGDTRVTATAAMAKRSACEYAAIRKGLTGMHCGRLKGFQVSLVFTPIC